MIDVLYEDNHIIAINKRSGDIVQGDITGDKPLNEMEQKDLCPGSEKLSSINDGLR